jgi:hypothetical protein
MAVCLVIFFWLIPDGDVGVGGWGGCLLPGTYSFGEVGAGIILETACKCILAYDCNKFIIIVKGITDCCV